MPAVPFIAAALGASGALTAIGTAIAGMAGLSVATGTVAASLAAGTISTAAATAIGAGTFAGLSTAIQGGKPSQILKSAVLGGVTSYAGSAIAGSIGDSVRASAMLSGTDQAIANAMGRVAGSAISGAISSGTSALLTGKGDPIEALLKGGVTAAFSAGIGESINSVLSKVPALANPLNNTEAAINRAMSAAIGTAIVSGGDVNKIGTAVLNSFAATAGGLIGQQIRDSSSQLSNANEQFRASERAYANNIQSQESLVNQYNAAIQPLISGKAQIDALIPQYDAIVWKYYNYHDWLTSEGYELRTTFGEYGSESYYVKPRYTQYGLVEDPLPESMYSDALVRQAKAIESQVTSLAQNLNSQYTSLFGGEVTKYKTETQLELVQEGWGETMNQYWVEREVQVPYTETVTGSLTPIKNQIDQLKSQTETLGQNYASAKTNLENAVANFNTTETANAAIVEQQLQNFTTARDQYKQQFGKEPTEEQLTNFARTGDILGTVGKLIADDRNENFAKEAGFKNYADFTAAGQVAPNEFYAKQQGWNSYAEQLKAQGMGLNTPQQYTTYQNNEQTAISQGFANYQDLQAAGNLPANDFYAKQSGWESYAQKQEAESSGLYSPSAWTNYQTEQKNQTLATNAGFPDYKTYEQFDGDKVAYDKSLIPPAPVGPPVATDRQIDDVAFWTMGFDRNSTAAKEFIEANKGKTLEEVQADANEQIEAYRQSIIDAGGPELPNDQIRSRIYGATKGWGGGSPTASLDEVIETAFKDYESKPKPDVIDQLEDAGLTEEPEEVVISAPPPPSPAGPPAATIRQIDDVAFWKLGFDRNSVAAKEFIEANQGRTLEEIEADVADQLEAYRQSVIDAGGPELSDDRIRSRIYDATKGWSGGSPTASLDEVIQKAFPNYDPTPDITDQPEDTGPTEEPVTPSPAPAPSALDVLGQPINPPAPAPAPSPIVIPGEDETEFVIQPPAPPPPSPLDVLGQPIVGPAPAPAPIVIPGEDDTELVIEPPAPAPPFVGPRTEEQTQRFNEEFAKYLDYLQAGEPPPPDYGVQDLGITQEDWDSFNQNLLQMVEEGRLPTQWQPNEDGTFTYMSDDGSTLTINPDGSIVGYTEAPIGNLPGETPPGGGGGRPPAPAPRPPAPAPAPRPPAPAPRPPAPAPRPPAPAPAAPGLDVAALLALLSSTGGGQQGQIVAPQQPVYAQTPEFDIVQAFAPTLYAERKKAENPYLSGLTDEV